MPNDSNPPELPPSDRRLNSWKSIGAFFERDERTVRRWEIERGLPVHRVPGAGRGSVYAYASELAEWLKTADTEDTPSVSEAVPSSEPSTIALPGNLEARPAATPNRRVGRLFGLAAIAVIILVGALIAFRRTNHKTTTAVAAMPAGLKPSVNPEAQDLYLQGLYHWNKRTPQDLHEALDNFTQSIVRDPNYAPAYAGLANCYNLLREYTLMPAGDAYPRAMAAAKRAIALDDSLADAHNSLAFVDFYWSWDEVAAEREFRRAIELDPSSPVAHHWYATFLMVLGREPEALQEIEEARKLDPQSSAILADKGLILFTAGQPDQSVALLKHIEVSEPAFLSPHAYLAVIDLQIRNYQDYLLELRHTEQILHDQHGLKIVAAGEKGFAVAGGVGMLRAMLPVEEKFYAEGDYPAYELATTYCLLGEKQRALALLRASVEKREARDVALRVDENLLTLHNEPAFRELLARVGLPPLS